MKLYCLNNFNTRFPIVKFYLLYIKGVLASYQILKYLSDNSLKFFHILFSNCHENVSNLILINRNNIFTVKILMDCWTTPTSIFTEHKIYSSRSLVQWPISQTVFDRLIETKESIHMIDATCCSIALHKLITFKVL